MPEFERYSSASHARSTRYAHKTRRSTKPWVVFIVLIGILSAIIWGGWRFIDGRSLIPTNIFPASNSTLTIGLRTAPASLDIRTDDSDSLQQALLENVYETLVKRDENNVLHPGLAQSWSVSNDGLNYKFRLRSGIKFANGDPMDSSSVLKSLQQGITKNYPGYEKLTNITSVSNSGPSVLNITLKTPDPLLPRRLAGRAGIVYNTNIFVNYASDAIGTGPFTVKGYNKGGDLVLARNNNYWAGQAGCQSITLKYFNDDTSLANAVKDGSVQMAIPLDGNENKRMAAMPNTKLVKGKSTRLRMFAFNTGMSSMFCDQQIRRAARHVIEPNVILASDPFGGQLVGGPIDPMSPGYEDFSNTYPHDVQKAYGMYHYFVAGYLRGITMLVPTGMASVCDQMAKNLSYAGGFPVKLEELDQSVIDQRIREGKYDLALTWTNHTLDSGMYADTKSNYLFQDHASQKYFADAMKSTSPQEYEENIKKYAKELCDYAVSGWLYARNSVVVAKSNVSGYPTNMTDQLLPLHDVTVK